MDLIRYNPFIGDSSAICRALSICMKPVRLLSSVSSSLSNTHLSRLYYNKIQLPVTGTIYHLTVTSSTRAHLSKMYTETLALDESQQCVNKLGYESQQCVKNKSLVFIDSCILYQYKSSRWRREVK